MTILQKLSTVFFVLIFLLSFVLTITIVKFLLVIYSIFSQKKIKNSVLFLENFPKENAGYYYRSKVWADFFKNDGCKAKVLTLFRDKKKWEVATSKGLKKFIVFSLWIRIYHLFVSLKYERVIVRRELLFYNEYGNLFLEKILIRIHPNCILDFDDDIGASKKEPRKIDNIIGKILMENGNKFNQSLITYKRFIVGSEYLKELLLSTNKAADILVVPTCVDFSELSPHRQFSPIVFGWTGITTNMSLLDALIPIFNKYSKDFSFSLNVISGQPYLPPIDPSFVIHSIPWSLENDQNNLSQINIGLMPLENSMMTKGKCGFKLIQYMSLGIPSIGQNITVNAQIIPSNEHGWLVNDLKDWDKAIFDVLNSTPKTLQEIGTNAFLHIQKEYTFEANYERMKSFVFRN